MRSLHRRSEVRVTLRHRLADQHLRPRARQALLAHHLADRWWLLILRRAQAQRGEDALHRGPLGEALRILDYWLYLMQGGARIAEPRDLGEYHYAQLFRVRRTAAAGEEHWLALKDAIEPNRRNLNGLCRVDLSMANGVALCERPRIAAWGVDTRLAAELASQLPPGTVQERLPVRRLELATADGVIAFESREP